MINETMPIEELIFFVEHTGNATDMCLASYVLREARDRVREMELALKNAHTALRLTKRAVILAVNKHIDDVAG